MKLHGRARARRTSAIATAAAATALLLAACEGVKEDLGLTKKAPDEFTVVTKAPLVLPPDYSLRPPRPGAPRPQETQPQLAARQAISGAGVQAGTAARATLSPRSAGEERLLRQANAEEALPDIRQVIDRETTVLVEKERSFADKLLFWQKPYPPGTVVDAQKEAQRLRQNAAEGTSVLAGDTPVIERRKRGILEGIF